MTNTHEPEVVSVTVTKTWAGPESTATIRLFADNVEVGSVSLPNEGSNTYTWTNLYKNNQGKEIVYTVAEDDIPYYQKGNVEGSVSEGFTITNTYLANGEIQLTATKELTGRTLAADQFDFTLAAVTEGAPLPASVFAKNDANGDILFDTIAFDQDDLKTIEVIETETIYKAVPSGDADAAITYVNTADETDVLTELPEDAVDNGDGTYTVTAATETETYATEKTFKYTITETAGSASGYTYSTDTVNVTVTVKDNGDNTLDVTAVYSPSDKTFVNAYEASGFISFAGSKELDGCNLEADQFSFVLKDANGNEVETVKNDANGDFAFSALEFNQDDVGKTIKYTVSEVNDGKAGYTYDGTVYEITVSVADGDNGTLAVTATGADEIVFNNTFTVQPVIVDPPVRKVVLGSPSTDGTFTFQMKAVTDGAPMPEGAVDGVKSVQIVGSGSYEFGIITYTEPGTYAYEITEVNDGLAGYTYDTTKYTLTVAVTDDADGDGYLDKNVTVEGGDGSIVFTNSYTKTVPPSTSNTPKTGDQLPIIGVALIVCVAAALAAVAFIQMRRRNEKVRSSAHGRHRR